MQVDANFIDAVKQLMSSTSHTHTKIYGNTYATGNNRKFKVVLHGNEIFQFNAKPDGSFTYKCSACGWPSKTTARRLNDCLEALSSTEHVIRHFKRGENGGEVKGSAWLELDGHDITGCKR